VKVKRQAWLENVKVKLAIGGVGVLIVVVLIILFST
jgi:hypothetical protein